MASEEIKVKLGLDSTPFSRGLAGVHGMAKRAATGIAGAFSSALGSLGGSFGGLLSLGAITAGIRSIISNADQLKNTSEALGVTTDFLQQMQGLMADNGVSAEKFNGALERMTRLLGDAQAGSKEAQKVFSDHGLKIRDLNGANKTAEAMFRDIANAMKAAGTESAATSIANDTLGKKTAAMTVLMRKGADEVERLASQIKIISETDIAKLDAVGDALAKFGRDAKTSGSSFLVGVGRILTQQADFSFFGPLIQKIKMLDAFRDKVGDASPEAMVAMRRGSSARAARESIEDNKKLAEAERQKLEMSRKGLSSSVADHAAMVKAQIDLQSLMASQGMMTLGEAASQDASRYNWTGRRNIWRSGQVGRLRTWAQENRLQGNFGLADRQEALAEQISAALAPFVRDPAREALDQQKATVKQLEGLNTRVDAGIKIQTD